MSMKINGSYAEQTQGKQALDRADKARKTNGEPEYTKASDKAPEAQDAYISSEKAGVRPSGLYRVGQDGNGRRKIFYEDPNRSGRADEKGQPKVSGDDREKPAEKCTTDTGKVDREIRSLREKKQQLEQQIRSAAGDRKKVRELERKLARVESELSQKDNDTYRRQHAVVSE